MFSTRNDAGIDNSNKIFNLGNDDKEMSAEDISMKQLQ
jgi:hypothetical protein